MERRTTRTATLVAVLLLAESTAIEAASFPNLQVNQRPNNPEETAIVLDPIDTSRLVGVAQSYCHYYASTDGGLTWAEGDLPDPFDLGDPAVAFDRIGNLFYCYIGLWNHSGIFVNRSTDGGRTWMPAGTPIIQHQGSVPFEDKSYPVCDWTQGPFRNSVYVCWTQFDHYGSSDPADSSRILFSFSRDHGETFSPPAKISDRGGDAVDSDATVEGAVPAVGPDGTIYTAWSGPRGIEFDRSTNYGASWGRDRVIAQQPGGWDFAVPGLYRANGLPVTKADLSYGPQRGRIYVNWSDQRNGDTDVFLIHSDDGGFTWSAPRRVNDDPLGNGKHQFFCWMDVDAVTGFVHIVYYDRRDHPAGSWNTDVSLASSQDGGMTFTNRRISETSFVPDPDVFFGDYIGISAFAGIIRPLWMRMDGSALSIWTALIDEPSASVAALPGHGGILRIVPNPTRGSARILLRSGDPAIVELEIHDTLGRMVRQLRASSNELTGAGIVWDGRDAEGRPVPAGVYLIGARGLGSQRVVLLPR